MGTAKHRFTVLLLSVVLAILLKIMVLMQKLD